MEGVIGWLLQESSNADQSILGLPPVHGVYSLTPTNSRSPIVGLVGLKEVEEEEGVVPEDGVEVGAAAGALPGNGMAAGLTIGVPLIVEETNED